MTGTADVHAFNIKVSSIIGAIVGLLNMVFITSRYFPVYIATVLKLRSGLFKSLDNEEFERYRSGIDNTWLILGFSFWGPIISSFMVSFIVMAVVYCFMDPNLRSSAIFFISTLAGLWIALGIRVLFVFIFQKRVMGGFYRNDPATSNVFGETVRGKVPKKQCFLPRSYIILIYFVLNRSLLRVLESLFGTGLHCVPYSKNCMLGCLPCWSH